MTKRALFILSQSLCLFLAGAHLTASAAPSDAPAQQQVAPDSAGDAAPEPAQPDTQPPVATPDAEPGDAAPDETPPDETPLPPEPTSGDVTEPTPQPTPVAAPAVAATVDEQELEGSSTAASAEPDADAPPAEDPKTEPPEDKPVGPTFVPGAQAFFRAQGRINPDFNNSDGTAADLVTVLERVRLQLLGTWGPVRVFAQVQDARSWGFEGSTTSNEANTDLHQGYLDLFGGTDEDRTSGFLRIGRQEIDWGSQRMIGSLLWLPGARSFDAIRAYGRFGRFSLDAWVAMLATPQTFTATDPSDPSLTFPVQTRGAQVAGGQFSGKIHKAFNFEAMALADLADAHPTNINLDRLILDFGGRLWGSPLEGLKYEVEGHGQAGKVGDLDHRAWAWVAKLGYVYGKPRVKPGANAGYAMASGSQCVNAPDDTLSNCGSSVDRDFFNFYPTNHIHYGLVDLLGWSNVRDLEIGASLQTEKLLKATLTYHYFQLHDAAGRWRNVGGAPVGAGWDPTNRDNSLGHEIDAVVVLKPWKPLMVQPGYGVFLPVGAGQNLGGPDPQHFLYLWLVATI